MPIENSEFTPPEKKQSGPTPEAILQRQDAENEQNAQRASEYRKVFLQRQNSKE